MKKCGLLLFESVKADIHLYKINYIKHQELASALQKDKIKNHVWSNVQEVNASEIDANLKMGEASDLCFDARRFITSPSAQQTVLLEGFLPKRKWQIVSGVSLIYCTYSLKTISVFVLCNNRVVFSYGIHVQLLVFCLSVSYSTVILADSAFLSC